jgi:carbamoyltransferase
LPTLAPLRHGRRRTILERFVLGLFDGPSGGAALARGKDLLAIAEEDRLVRRHRVSGLPRASVQTVIREAGIPAEEIGVIFVATRDATYAEGVGAAARPPLLYRVGTALPSPPQMGRRIRGSFASARRRRVDEALRSEFGFSCPIEFLDHHLVHAVGAAYATGQPDCLAITMDQGADDVWATVTSFRDGRPERLAAERLPGSVLGFLEEVCTQLGIPEGLDRYNRLEDLFRRGEPLYREHFEPLFRVVEGRLRFHNHLLRTGGALGRVPTGARKVDIVASAVQVAGDMVRRAVAHWCEATDHDRLVLGGDLFMVCPVLQRVLAGVGLPAYLPPAPGNDGLPVGAAFAGCVPDLLPDAAPVPRVPLPSPFLGIEYDDVAIERVLLSEGYAHREHENIEREVARLLAEGRSVARFAGKTEIGNRGLGNRSILQSPLGRLRRGRAGFLLMPSSFHALVPVDSFGAICEDDGVSPAALLNVPMPVRARPHFLERCPDLACPEQRVRVQTVGPESNPRLLRILQEFAEVTGLPCLAVAPFRLPDEPLVSGPRDALRTFRRLGADVAAFASFVVDSPDRLTGLAGGAPATDATPDDETAPDETAPDASPAS